MKKTVRGSLTIEAAVIVPILLWVFAVVIMLLLYYHDKNVVTVTAHETAVVGCGTKNMSSEEMEVYFQKRLFGKLLLFPNVDIEAKLEEKDVHVYCKAQKNGMMFRVKISMQKTEPEELLRKLRWIGEWNENILQE